VPEWHLAAAGDGLRAAEARRTVNFFVRISLWITKKWYGIFIAYFIIFAAIYLLIWQILEPVGIADTFRGSGCAYPLNRRFFWHFNATMILSPMVTILIDALMKRSMWRNRRSMMSVRAQIAQRLGNNETSVLEEHQASGTFEILKAVYWTRNSKVDVTEAVRSKIHHNSLTVTADDSLGGDPEFAAEKQLTIRYEAGGVILEKTLWENETVTLP
jgi:hypothetical protein